MSETKIRCSSCGNDKKMKDYYTSQSPIHKYYGRLPVCKECLLDMVDAKDIQSVMNVLRMCDKPFITSLWQSSIKESEKNGRSVFGMYMKNVSMQQHKDKTWDDSEFENEIEVMSQSSDLSEEVLERWRGWDKESIINLEDKYQELINNYEHDTPIQRNIYRNIAVTQMKADEAIAAGSTNEYQKLMKVISDLMNDANIKPLQETGANSTEQATFGTLVKQYENENPIPEPDEEWKDVDGIQHYVSVWFLGHLCKMLGITNEYTRMYDGEIDNYTVEQPENDNGSDTYD